MLGLRLTLSIAPDFLNNIDSADTVSIECASFL